MSDSRCEVDTSASWPSFCCKMYLSLSYLKQLNKKWWIISSSVLKSGLVQSFDNVLRQPDCNWLQNFWILLGPQLGGNQLHAVESSVATDWQLVFMKTSCTY